MHATLRRPTRTGAHPALLLIPCVATFLGASAPAAAQATFVSFYWENDTFYDTDQSYTNGARIAAVTEIADQTSPPLLFPARLLGRLFQPLVIDDDDRGWEWAAGWVLGQNMYSPQDITIPTVIEDDRPYGGFLYLGPNWYVFRPDQGSGDLRQRAQQHRFEVVVGTLGPSSLADETQTFVHEHVATGAPEPQGWDHQIRDEPVLQIDYQGKLRLYKAIRDGVPWFDLSPGWEAYLGNAFTHLGGSLQTRLGLNLGDDFGGDRITPVAVMEGRTYDWELYLFAAAAGRAVARNAFLDGGLFGADDPHTVSKKHLVGDLDLGIHGRYRAVSLGFRWVIRSPEFEEREIRQEYGALVLTLLF